MQCYSLLKLKYPDDKFQSIGPKMERPRECPKLVLKTPKQALMLGVC